jgi:hypothetical protein
LACLCQAVPARTPRQLANCQYPSTAAAFDVWKPRCSRSTDHVVSQPVGYSPVCCAVPCCAVLRCGVQVCAMLVECLELRRKWLFRANLQPEQRRVRTTHLPAAVQTVCEMAGLGGEQLADVSASSLQANYAATEATPARSGFPNLLMQTLYASRMGPSPVRVLVIASTMHIA